MSRTEFEKKGCKNQIGPGSINESNRVQKAANCKTIICEWIVLSNRVQMIADRKKMNERCDSVNGEKRMMSLAVNTIRDKTSVNEMEPNPAQDSSRIEKKELNGSFLGFGE